VNARALSIRQPWASLIMAGHKTVENRTWGTPWRGLLAIHTGKRLDEAAAPLAERFNLAEAPTGCYLGWVELVDVHHDDRCGGCTPWAEPGAWHFVLACPRPLARPVEGRGRLGLYPVPAELLQDGADR